VETEVLTGNEAWSATSLLKQNKLEYNLDCLCNTRKLNGSTIMRKWKELYLNGYECKNNIYTMMESLNSWWDRTSTSMCSRFIMENNDPSAQYISHI
jgi:hypothetical protein